MSIKRFMKVFLITFLLMFSIVNFANAEEVKFTVNPAAGSTVAPGDDIVVKAYYNDKTKGLFSLVVKLYNDNNEVVASNTVEPTDTIRGNNPVYCTVLVPEKCKSESLKAVVTVKDSTKATKSVTFKYVGPGTSNDDENDEEDDTKTKNDLTITSTVASGSKITKGKEIKFTTTSSNKYVGTKTTKIYIYNYSTGNLVDTVSATSTQELGANPFTLKINALDAIGTFKYLVRSTDINGTTEQRSFVYHIGSSQSVEDNDDIDDEDDDTDDNDDLDEDEEVYEGVINPDLDDLVVDLWLVEDERFYELEEDEIPFVAYYYNAEKKIKEDVVIEIEIPDGFDVVSKSAEVGTVKYKNDTLTYKLGDVEGKELNKVYFTLVAEDDDLCEEATNITAIIYSDEDDEEDQSTQRIWIYEEDGDGEFTSYVTGYVDGTFRPDNNITREEVAAIMARAFNHKVYSTIKAFTDVPTTNWAHNYITACANKGIIKGYTDGTFKPYNNITRAELYAMTYRAMEISEDEKALFVPKEYKKDDSWEKNYIAGLVRLKMLEDMDDRDADEYATRAEVVYLVNGVQFRNPSKMMDVHYTDLYSSHWCAKDIAAASCNYTFERGSNGKEIVKK